MSDVTRIWRLGLPEDWEPEDYWCVSFKIPAGEDYVNALSAAIGLLTLSKTFERDETHTGAATVAKTWKRAIMLEPMTVDTDCPAVEPIPVPDEEAAADISAAIFTRFYRVIVNQLNACAPTGDDCADCVDTLYASLVAYGATPAIRGALMTLCADLNELSPSQRAEYDTDCVYTAQFEDLSGQISANPYDWLNNLSSWLFDWLNETSDRIMNDLNTVGGLIGGSGMFGYVQDNGGIPSGGGADFGSDCPWIITVDFAAGDGGFTNLNGWTNGLWVDGTGWTAQYSEGQYGSADNVLIDVVVSFPASFNITHAEYLYDLAGGDWETSAGSPYYVYLRATGVGDAESYGIPSANDQVFGFDPDGICNGFRIQIIAGNHNIPPHGSPGGSATLRSLTIHGSGTKPYPV